MNKAFEIETPTKNAWCDITRRVADVVTQCGQADGVVTVFIPHTTAGVTIQENADAPLQGDISRALERLFPWHGDYRHCEDNAAAHMKVVLMGPSVQVPFVAGEMLLGQWQAIYLCEFDGPRRRRVVVHVSP